jgi:hypothetical protein
MRLLITGSILLGLSIPAQAAHHRYHHHYIQRSHHRAAARSRRRADRQASYRRRYRPAAPHEGGIVTVRTAVGPITVARSLAGRFEALITDLIAHGYRPRQVGCFARGGHMPNSRHYAGAACDFDQSGRNRTAAFMYHARAIIARHGLRDGCSFGDCGHVDDGRPTYYAQRSHRGRSTRYAHHWGGRSRLG